MQMQAAVSRARQTFALSRGAVVGVVLLQRLGLLFRAMGQSPHRSGRFQLVAGGLKSQAAFSPIIHAVR
jgi:hypothetical protein